MIDYELLPEAAEREGIDPKHDEAIRRYLEIIDRFEISELIRVWDDGERLLVVQNYPCFRSYQKLYRENPSAKVACLVLSGGSRADVIQYGMMVKELTSAQIPKQLSRLLQLKILMIHNPKITYEEFKYMRGVVGKMQSKEGKEAERDFKIASSDYFFCGLLGIDDMAKRPLAPNLGKAIFTYRFCYERLLRVLGHEVDAQKRFQAEYDQYISGLRMGNRSADEEVRPIFTWQNYNAEAVAHIATAVAGFRNGRIFRPEDQDAEWKVEGAADLSVKISAFNVARNAVSDAGFRRLVEAAYVAQLLYRNFIKLIRAIRPARHGVRCSFSDADLSTNPLIEVIDQIGGYEKFVRSERVLFYSNRGRLFKSYGLVVNAFGFVDYGLGQTTTWKQISNSFEQWFNTEFLQNVVRRSGYLPERHPRHFTFKTITGELFFLE
jgi:hypothetical protein